jgi:tetratricopeptide (TPR) repeat protein
MRARPSIEDRDGFVRAAEEALEVGRFADAEERASRAVEAADGAPSGGARSVTRRLHALALLEGGREAEAEAVANEASRIARAARSARDEAAAETALADIATARGDYIRALRHAERSEELAVRTRDDATKAAALADHALALARIGDGEISADLFDEALSLAQALPPRLALPVHHRFALFHRQAGRWSAAFEALDRADELAHAARVSPAGAAWPLATARVATLVDVGATEAARDALAALERDQELAGPRRAEVFALSAHAALAAGERPEMVERLAFEGLAEERACTAVRMQLERLRAASLLARGRAEERCASPSIW